MSLWCRQALSVLALALPAVLGLLGPLRSFHAQQMPVRSPARCVPLAQADATDVKQNVITCSNCKASYAVEQDTLGSGAGRRVRCSICDHEWFQSMVRLSPLPDNMQLVEYPEEMKDRLAAGKPAEVRAAFRAYVGNIAFGTTEEDLTELFAPYGAVVRVNMMTDDDGRSRGFAFVNMEKVDEGLAAVAAIDGTEFLGRTISVSEGKQNTPPRGRGAPDGRGRGRGEFRGRGRGESRGRGGGGRGGGRGRGSYD
jgi:predicted Zn finger-like uncharacterized protein